MQIFFCYHDLFDVFNKTIFEILFEHALCDHVIDIEKSMFFFESIYNLFMFEIKILRKYLNKNLINNFIVFSIFRSTFLLFLLKKNDSFRLCINYRKFNAIKIRNKYFLLLISQLFVFDTKNNYFHKIKFSFDVSLDTNSKKR